MLKTQIFLAEMGSFVLTDWILNSEVSDSL